MKVLISLLLLTIAVFLNFGELNASVSGGEGSSSRAYELPKKTFDYKGKLVKLSFNIRGRLVEVDYEGNYLPSEEDYKSKMFAARITEVAGYRAVEYVGQNGKFFGLRPPRPGGHMEPDDDTWYITYEGKSFEARGNPKEFKATSIAMLPHGNKDHQPKFLKNQKAYPAYMAGLNFYIVKGGLRHAICAARLTEKVED